MKEYELEANPRTSNRSKSIRYRIEGGCWICTSHKPDGHGYPQIRREGKNTFCYKHIYRKFKGDIPEGLEIMHTCDNKLCINPKHLLAGTHAQNVRDSFDRGLNLSGSRCPWAKLNEKDVQEIRSSKLNQRRLSEKYNVSFQHISDIISMRRWKRV